jgi:hypothetical protein
MAGLIGAARRSGALLDCRVSWWPSRVALSIEGSAASVALDVHLQDGGVVNETVDGGERHGLITEHC